MTSENTDWAVGSTVLGRFLNKDEEPPVLFRVIHRTKHFATVQRHDDWARVYRKRIQKVRGEWSVLIGPLWLRPGPVAPGATSLTLLAPGHPSSSAAASSGDAAPASSSPGQAVSE